MLFGLHAVRAALENPDRDVLSVRATENAAQSLSAALTARGLTPEIWSAADLSRTLGSDTVHQGVGARVRPLDDPGLSALAASDDNSAPRLLVLDQVTDPHNVGAIIRSAAVLGASGLVMPRRHSAPLSDVTAKAASGGLEHVPIVLVGNLAQALRTLARMDYRIVGLDGDGATLLSADHARGPLALVLGAEGPGLRRLTRENCDEICRLPTPGPLRSLNVSNAAAVALTLTLPET